MEIGIVIIIAIFVLWVLFVRGALWNIFLILGGWFGIYFWLETQTTWAKDIIVTVADSQFSWSEVLPTGIVFFLFLTRTVTVKE